MRRPARAASIVIRASQPNPAATGKHAARAAGESARWPDSGSRGSKPDSSSIKPRATRLAIPKPPPIRSENTATFRSAPSSRSGFSSPDRSPSESRSPPGRRRALRGRQRLPLAAPWQSQHDRTCLLGDVGRPVARAVVGHDHLRRGKRPPQRSHRRPDRRLLVACGDEDRQRFIHSWSSPAPGGRSAGGRRRTADSSLRSCRSRRDRSTG